MKMLNFPKLKAFKLILTFTLLFVLCSLAFSVYSQEAPPSEIRVGLYYSTTALDSATISGSDGFYVKTESDSEAELVNVNSLKLSVSSKGKAQVLTLFGGAAAQANNGKKISIYPVDGAIMTVAGSSYRGHFEIYADSNNKLVIINVIDIEEYLKGVLPSEVYPSWKQEALKAAAVASRTYAAKRVLSSPHSSIGFDICASTHCQMYSGTKKEAASTNQAITATKGIYVYYNGGLATTPYHSSSGGGTESAAGAWGGNPDDYPYLTTLFTPYEDYRNVPNGKWLNIIPRDTVTDYVSTLYRSRLTGDIASFDYERTKTGYIQSMTVTDENGFSIKLTTSGSVRSFFGTLVKSANFGIADTYVPSMRVTSGIPVISSTGEYTYSGLNGYSYITSDGLKTTPGFDEVTVFDGQGYGHGVGMSQFGAMCMADAGFTYDEIISHYFPGTDIITIQ